MLLHDLILRGWDALIAPPHWSVVYQRDVVGDEAGTTQIGVMGGTLLFGED